MWSGQAGRTGLSAEHTLGPDWVWFLCDFLILSFRVDFFLTLPSQVWSQARESTRLWGIGLPIFRAY